MAAHNVYAGGPLPRYLLLFATLFLLFGGLIMVYSASSVADLAQQQDSMYHLKRQALGALGGLVLMAVAMLVDYRRARWASIAVYGGSLIGLGLVFFMGVGKWGATRWIDMGFFTIQPSEYAKLGCVMVAALLIQQHQSGRISSADFWRRLFGAVGIVVLFLMMQPDLGTTFSILLAVFLVLMIGGVDARFLWGGVFVGLVALAGAIAMAPYRLRRLFAFLDPWADPLDSGYQSIQAMYAFGSGGLGGVGLGMSRQKFFYLPAAHTDFIFAIIGEELGFIGSLSVLLAFGVIAYAGVRIALGTKDVYGRLLVGGLTAMLVTQAIINMAAVTGLVPVTGIPLPFVSFGGSSMTFTMLCIGVILSVSTYGARTKKRAHVLSKESASASSAERRGNCRSHLSGVDGGRSAVRRRA